MPQPISPYGVSKLAAEQYCMGLHAADGIEVAALRCFNVFGPRQDPSSQYSGVIPKFLTQALDGVPLVVYGDGAQSRDFTHVENVAAATMSASERRLDGPLICNVGCGSAHTVLAEAVGRVAERAVRIEYVPARPGCARTAAAEALADAGDEVAMMRSDLSACGAGDGLFDPALTDCPCHSVRAWRHSLGRTAASVLRVAHRPQATCSARWRSRVSGRQ